MRELPAAPPAASPPERSPAQNRVSYIPEMRPISQISIDVNSKAKAGNAARPETTQAIPTSEFPAVPAAAAYELQHPIPALGQRTDASFAHKPLYFEEVNLERYGRSWGAIQPAISTTRFFATVPLLPYKMTAYPPHKEYYVDWPYEAGRCAPPVREALPFKPRAALVEAGVLTGAFFVIP